MIAPWRALPTSARGTAAYAVPCFLILSYLLNSRGGGGAPHVPTMTARLLGRLTSLTPLSKRNRPCPSRACRWLVKRYAAHSRRALTPSSMPLAHRRACRRLSGELAWRCYPTRAGVSTLRAFNRRGQAPPAAVGFKTPHRLVCLWWSSEGSASLLPCIASDTSPNANWP